VVFERSIFHDCDIDSDASGTKIVLNTTPVTRYAVVPLEEPPRLLVTFTPQGSLTPMNSTIGANPLPSATSTDTDPAAN
jgi:hypothetical protein